MKIDFIDISEQKREEIENLNIIPMGKLKETVGQKFGKWTVLGRGPEKDSRHPKLWCICDCEAHNIRLVDVGVLRNGKSSSCGCVRKEKSKEHLSNLNNNKNLVGQSFGDFEVIEKTSEKQNGYYVYKCKCKYCHSERMINTNHLYQNANVCGCQISNGSSFERKVTDILRDNQILFLREKSFDNFTYSDTNRKPRFDFYLPEYNCLIELDGEQHFKEFSLSKYSLQEIQEKDKIKTEWALQNHFHLIRIPYFNKEMITIKDLLPLTSEYLIKE